MLFYKKFIKRRWFKNISGEVIYMATHDTGWKRLYANLIKTYNAGYGAVLGRFSGLLNLFFTVATFFLVKGLDLGFIETIGIFVIAFSGLMLLGYIYLKLDLQKSEFSSNFREQPEMVQLIKDVKEIKELLMEKEEIGDFCELTDGLK